MFLGIEIGGTKLQLGIGRADGPPLAEIRRFDVTPAAGAQAILRQIEHAGRELLARHAVQGIGVAFGGPVDAANGVIVKSHHVEGWAGFPIVKWCQQNFGPLLSLPPGTAGRMPVVRGGPGWGAGGPTSKQSQPLPVSLDNDADLAALAEARFGAGRGCNPVLYVTVGTGIGGGLIVDGKIYRGHGLAAIELGHLRPGLDSLSALHNLESLAAGWGIADQARQRIADAQTVSGDAQDLLAACSGNAADLTARIVVDEAARGNVLARAVWKQAVAALGWGLAQAITILSPQAIVIGGGVSLAGEELFFQPLRAAIEAYIFPPLSGAYQVVPAMLGEEVVVHGALALAADMARTA